MTKKHILAEIKRTAIANEGKAFGKQRFCTETGIKESDWYCKYWARWSDAVQEAGFAPNQKQGKLDADDLVLALIDLTRELGRYPVVGDLRLKAKIRSGFPAHTTFTKRFGSKLNQVAKVKDYCESRGGYADVVALCDQVVAKAMDTRWASENANEVDADDSAFGFVYLMKSGRYYKVGRSNAVGRRRYELAIQLPEKLTEVHRISTDDPTGIEAYWHRRFQDKRKNGEWFDLDPQDVKAFRRRKFM